MTSFGGDDMLRNQSRGIHWICVVFLGLLSAGCHRQIRRYEGPVQLILTSALIAPVNDAGRPWDGTNPLPREILSGLQAPRSRGAAASLLRTLIDSTGIGSTVASAIPWAANELLSGVNAPDVVVEIYKNGRRLLRSSMIDDSYNPTWAGEYTAPIQLHESDDLEIRAVDIDAGVFSSDEQAIGVCTSRGMPFVDPRGYIVDRTFKCHGHLWAVLLRVRPATEGRAQTSVARLPQ